MIRLQKYLASCGIASRRKAEELITAGRISVNGIVVTELGAKINEQTDEVLFDGNIVSAVKQYTYIMLHKPENYITSASDQFDRPTVLDLVQDAAARVFPVGRLDYDTSGLLILTDDGDLTFRLTHPKHNIDKIYLATIKGKPLAQEMERFETGLIIDGYLTKPSKISIVHSADGQSTVKVTIREGRNRQVRKMLTEIGHPVLTLKRVATGKLTLGDLPKGNYRHLTDDEIQYLHTC